MADKTISQLPSGVPPQANDEYIVARGAANYKLTLGNILGAPTPIGSVTPNTATFTTVTATTGNITSVNATTVDATNVEVDNVKAKDGTASLVFGNTTGNIGLGASPTTNVRFQIGGNLVVASNQAIGTSVVGTIPSTATTGYVGFTSQPTTEATAFTATDMEHFLARPQSFGAGSSVTNQYGFRASSLMTGATNNFGFRSDINEAAGRWNFYTGGTAANYFAGSTGIGATPNATDKLNIAGTLPSSSTNSFAVINRGVVPSATTGTALGYSTALTTEAASFTVTNLSHFRATQGTLGAGSAITSQVGFEVQSSLTGATNNYGFYSNIASGSNRWNFYAAGTANNYFAGNVGIGTTSPSYTLDVDKASATFRVRDASGGNDFSIKTVAGPVSLAGSIANTAIGFMTNDTERMRIDPSGNVIVNTAAIATTATDGFLYVPSCAGTPTGTPTSYTGRVPIVVDTTNNKLYFYSNGTWRDAGP